MPRIALFVDRVSVGERVHLIECVTCDWYVDYFDFTDPGKHSSGRLEDAIFEVSIHARKSRHGVPRIVQGRRP